VRIETMNGPTFYRGVTIGWNWAVAYAAGTKFTRRDIRRKLVRMADSHNRLVEGIWYGFNDYAGQQADAILAGMAPRTVNPHKFRRVLERV
jgi:hypothetical protein